MSQPYRKPLPGTTLEYFDAREAVDAIQPGAYDKLPYTARVHAENIVRKADPARRDAYLSQLIERKRDLDFPWFPARVVCHDILGQTALVDLAVLVHEPHTNPHGRMHRAILEQSPADEIDADIVIGDLPHTGHGEFVVVGPHELEDRALPATRLILRG